DFEGDERIAVARPSQLAEADAIGIRRRELHVLDDLVPSHELVVRADCEAEELLGCLQLAGGGGDERGGEDEDGNDSAADQDRASGKTGKRAHIIVRSK